MTTPTNQDLVVAGWCASGESNLEQGIGLLVYRSDARIEDMLTAARPNLTLGSAIVLPLLTEEFLDNRSVVTSVLAAAAGAVRSGRAVLAATPLSEAALAGDSVSSAEPQELNAAELVARSELAYVLERTCLARAHDDGYGASYLTPIEARLARALRREQLTLRTQVAIGAYCVDFLAALPGSAAWIVVECDGAGFHTLADDVRRDEELNSMGYRVLRFTGSQIYRDAASCAERVVSALQETPHSSPVLAGDSQLSNQQLAAAAHRDGPARVAAPAGSGKTRVIAARVRQLVTRGVDPERICAISFTNKAVDEMRDRLSEVADEVTFTTIHALAKQVAERAGHQRTLIQGIPPDTARFVPTRWAVLKTLLEADEYKFAQGGNQWVDAVNSFRQSFELPDFEDWSQGHRPNVNRFREVCASFDRALSERNLTDFEGWVHDAVRALARDPARRAIEAGKFDYWVVDEYQDLPRAKLKLLRLLVAPARNVFVVGDDDQVLYGFAGASPDIFAAFSDEFPGAAEYSLDVNYRSPHELVVRSNWLIARNNSRVAKDTRPHLARPEQDVVDLETREDYDARAHEFVRARLEAGAAPEQVAVLFRLRDMAIPVETRLVAANIRHTTCSHQSFFHSKPVQALMAWLILVAGVNSNIPRLLRLTLTWPNRYLKKDTINGLLDVVAHQQPQSLQGVLDTAAQFSRSITDHQADALNKYVSVVRNSAGTRRPAQILERLKLRDHMLGEKALPGQASPAVIHDVFSRLAAQFASVEDLVDWTRREGSNQDYDYTPVAEPSTEPGAVTLASVHQAKGLEWDHVAVVGPLGGMPDRRANTPERLEEERRIAYVAVTRARESLLFCASPGYARELGERGDGLSWDDYKKGMIAPAAPVRQPSSALVAGRRHPKRPEVRSLGIQARVQPWAEGIPEGASKRRGVWVLRERSQGTDVFHCGCGLNAWKPPVNSTCPDCGSPLAPDGGL